MHLFDALTGEVVQELEPVPYGWISSLTWQSQDEFIVGTISDGRVVRWGRRDGRVDEVLSAENPFTSDLQPESDLLAVGDESRVSVITLGGLKKSFPLTDGKRVAGVAWNSTGQYLAAMSDSHLVEIWDEKLHKIVGSTRVCGVDSEGFGQFPLAWHPMDNQFATVDALGRLSIWDLKRAQCQQLKIAWGHTGPAWCVAWSPDGKRIATGVLDGQVILWDSSSLFKLLHFDQESAVGTVSWSPDGNFLVTEGGDKKGRLELRYAP